MVLQPRVRPFPGFLDAEEVTRESSGGWLVPLPWEHLPLRPEAVLEKLPPSVLVP